MKSIYIYIVIVFLLFGCKKEIQVNIADRAPSLVLNAELNADSFIRINISQTQNITDNSDKPYVSNAMVEVMDKDSLLLESLTYIGFGDYQSNIIKPITGSKYLIRVRHENKLYWANERMPDSLKTAFVDTSRIIFQGKKNFFQFRMKITDAGAQDNFYAFKLKRIYEKYIGNDTIFSEEWVNIESIDFILTQNPESRFSKKQVLFKDTYFNGVVGQEIIFGTSDLFGLNNQKTKEIIVYICSYSFQGYRYFTSVNQHLLYQNDPFSQPTLIIGNIEGAYGAITGGFTKKYRIKLD